jgi:hypothetical protein
LEPTVPNVILDPCTVPVRFVGLFPKEETLIVPLNCDPDCCQLREKVPLKAPL